MSITALPIPIDREAIAGFCCERGIRRLSLFGSVLRADFERLVEVIGEAVKRLPEDLRLRHPQPSWRKIASTPD